MNKNDICKKIFIGFGIGILFVAPWLFTRPYIANWSFFDFSHTGSIGDTIGGITAPIVGIVSIMLLWWTLKEQQKFNQEQVKINEEQAKFNDASRILSMENHIFQLDDNLRYAFSGADRTLEGKGLSSLYILATKKSNITILRNELERIIDQVHLIDIAVRSLANLINHSRLSEEEKKPSQVLAKTYFSYISHFYQNVANKNIVWISPPADLFCKDVDLPDPEKEMIEKVLQFNREIERYL